MKAQRRVFILAAVVVLAAAPAAQAQLAVTSNDNKVMLDNGTVKIVQNPAPDTVTILDLTASPPRVVVRSISTTSGGLSRLSAMPSGDESSPLIQTSSAADSFSEVRRTRSLASCRNSLSFR